MQNKINSHRGGFTLVEIMIVVAIIALLASIAVPSFLRARKRSQATATLETCRMIDGAKDQYAIEAGKPGGIQPTGVDLQPYVKKNSKLYNDLTSNKAYDPLGREITIGKIDEPVTVHATTKSDLESALNNDANAFFGAYR